VEDVVRANIAAAETDFDHVPVINVACNRSNDLLRLVEIFQELSGSSRDPQFGPERAGDIKHSLADNSRMKSLLNVSPQTTFQAGLRKLWQTV